MKLNRELNVGVLVLVFSMVIMTLALFVLKDIWELLYGVSLLMFLSGAILVFVGSIKLLGQVFKTL